MMYDEADKVGIGPLRLGIGGRVSKTCKKHPEQ